ncbi:MAG: hypothetical protein Q9167_005788 [Letrouitia subvulpina]
MSFGWSASDIANLVKLAWTTVQNCKKACGEYLELTRQVQSLYSAIKRLRHERSNLKSLLNRPEESCWEELRLSLDGSLDVLQSLNTIVAKYASVNRKDKGLGRLWTRAKFGNKELDTINDLRQKARFYTGTISTLLNTVTVGSLGRIENSLNEAGLKEIKPAIEDIARKLVASNNREGSVLTAYPNDDTAVWKELRRELVKENVVPSDIISKNKNLITEFIRKLGERGELDEPKTEDEGNEINVETNEIDDDSNEEPCSTIESSSGESTDLQNSDKPPFHLATSNRKTLPISRKNTPHVHKVTGTPTGHTSNNGLRHGRSTGRVPVTGRNGEPERPNHNLKTIIKNNETGIDLTLYFSDDVSLSSQSVSNIPTGSDNSFEQPRNRININEYKTLGHTDQTRSYLDEQ